MLRESNKTIPVCFKEPLLEPLNTGISSELLNKMLKKEFKEVLSKELIKMMNTGYWEYRKIHTDVSVELGEISSRDGYYNQKTEKYFIPTSIGSSVDAELVAINVVLVCRLTTEVQKFCIVMELQSSIKNISLELDKWFMSWGPFCHGWRNI